MTHSHPTRLLRLAGTLALIAGTFTLAACDDDARVARLDERVSQLASQVDDLADENGKLEKKLDAARTRLQHLEDGLAGVQRATLDVGAAVDAAAGETEDTAVAPAAALDSSSGASGDGADVVTKLRTMLQDEAARQVIVDALETERRGRRMERAEERIDRFAERAQLSGAQAERLGELLSQTRDRIRTAFEESRAAGGDREAVRATVAEARAALDSELKALLSTEQYEQFKESRLADPGGGRRRGGRGGDGGRGGRR